LLNDQWVIEEIREEIKKFLKFNENENTTYQNIWDIAKEVLTAKFVVWNALGHYLRSFCPSNICIQGYNLSLIYFSLICALKSFSVCLIKLGALTLGADRLIIVISF
jgi:hypothetical protein